MRKNEKALNNFRVIYDQDTAITSFQYIAHKNNVNLLLSIMEGQPDFFKLTDIDGNTLLHYAVLYNAYELCSFIVENCNTYPFYDTRHFTPAHLAASRNNLKLLQILSKSYVLITSLSSQKWTSLHFAIYHHCYESVQFLIKKFPSLLNSLTIGNEFNDNLKYNNLKFVSPLDLAIILNQHDIIKLLENNDALPSLHAAVLQKDYQAITFLVESKWKEYSNRTGGKQQNSVIHIAVQQQSCRIMHYLLKMNIPINIENKNGFTPLEIAPEYESQKIIKMLIKHALIFSELLVLKAAFRIADLAAKKNVELTKKLTDKINYDENLKVFIQEIPISLFCNTQIDGDTLLIRLIKKNLPDSALLVLDVLGNNNECINIPDSRGATALHYASVIDNSLLLEKLIAKNSDVNKNDTNGLSPMMYALLAGSKSSTEILAKYNPDKICNCGLSSFALNLMLAKANEENINAPPKMPRNLYPIGNHSNFYTIDIHNIKHIIQTHSLNTRDLNERTFNENINVDNSLDQGKNPNLNDENINGNNDDNGFIELFSENVKRFINTLHFNEITNKRISSISNLHLAALAIDTMSIRMTSAANMDSLFDKDSFGRTPLSYAIIHNKVQIVNELFQLMVNHNSKHSNLYEYCDVFGNSYIHYINNDIFLPFIREKRDFFNFYAKNNHNQTIFHLLCKHDCFKIISFIFSVINNYEFLALKDNEGKTAFDYSFENKAIKSLEFLHSIGFENLLIEAVKNDDEKTVLTLLENGYPSLSYDTTMKTPLHYAAELGNHKMVKIFNNLVSASKEDKREWLPIHYAAKINNIECILELLPTSPILNVKLRPFSLCTNIKYKTYLYFVWKRQFFLNLLLDLFDCRISFIQKIIFPFFERNRKLLAFAELYQRLIFIGSIYSQNISFFSPLQHILCPFECFSCDNEQIHEGIDLIINSITLNIGEYFNIIRNLTPLLTIIIDINFLLQNAIKFLISGEEEFDSLFHDDKLYLEFISEHMNDQEEIAQKLFEKLYSIETIQDHLFIEFKAPDKSYFCNGLYFSAAVKIVDKNNKIQLMMNNDRMGAIRQFFPKYNFPMHFPYGKTEMTLAITKDFLIGSNHEVFYAIPIPFLSVVDNGDTIRIYTQSGYFSFVFINPDLAKPFLNVLTSRNLQHTGFHEGESMLDSGNVPKKKYLCVVSYLLNQIREIRILMVNSCKKENCYDACKSHITSLYSTLYNQLTVITKEPDPNYLFFVE
ncbi:hypothetical protein TRFO_15273 [Tritrichomonas foetus]|uniref:DUF3447 domain-containing protein n=1 Tax=Tritrichomonas foetus TaxID=1144522 RepID=A0A1J4KXC6_9EUKA|nr:hypothetical protein TRFO_15273 [Tritrichomonas foetus]|eukprot:OHT14356.1 hypothetical protein TRFO_15273 [Tritrichomonas foetus]